MRKLFATLMIVAALALSVPLAASAFFVDENGHRVYGVAEWNNLNLTVQQAAQREALGELIACVTSDEKPSDVGFNHVSC